MKKFAIVAFAASAALALAACGKTDDASDEATPESVEMPEDLMPAAVALAREIADNTSAVSVSMTRAMLWHNPSLSHPIEAHRVDSRAIYTLSRGPDAAEGISSFLEKRAPRYPGRVSSDMPAFYPWWDEPDWE